MPPFDWPHIVRLWNVIACHFFAPRMADYSWRRFSHSTCCSSTRRCRSYWYRRWFVGARHCHQGSNVRACRWCIVIRIDGDGPSRDAASRNACRRRNVPFARCARTQRSYLVAARTGCGSSRNKAPSRRVARMDSRVSFCWSRLMDWCRRRIDSRRTRSRRVLAHSYKIPQRSDFCRTDTRNIQQVFHFSKRTLSGAVTDDCFRRCRPYSGQRVKLIRCRCIDIHTTHR